MTYKELLQQLQQLSEEQLNQRVVLYDTFGEDGCGEYYSKGIEFVFATEECDVLNVNYPIIRF